MAEFKLDVSEIATNLDFIGKRMDAAVMMYMNTKAPQVQSYMQTHRVWTDRTGQAKRMLSAKAEQENKRISIKLQQGVSYGIWLELAHEKRYAIIEPTVIKKGPEVMKGISNLMERLKE